MRRLVVKPCRSRAFTLIELLVVIVILGILMAVAVPTFLSQQQKAQDSRTEQYLTTAFKAIRAGLPNNNEVYPASTSMVSWIRQSEPELTAQSGSCLTEVQSAPQDAVLVDPSSTPTSLQLCARSQSGNVWKLTASNTGIQQLLNGTLVALSESGGLITDTTRAAGVQGDGLAGDSSTGIWEGTTNLVPNGGFETGMTGWSGASGSTISRDTSSAKFGSASLEAINAVTPQAELSTNITVSAGSAYTASAWVRGTGTAYLSYDERDSTNTHVAWYNSSVVTLTGSWQRLTVTRTPASGDTYAGLIITGSSGGTLWIDGVQLEQKRLATPYVETDGAAASRSSSRVQAPAGLLQASQGWVAMRFRAEWPNSALPNSDPYVFSWATDSGDRYALVFEGTGAYLENHNGSQQEAAFSGAVTVNPGNLVTVIGAWTSSTLYLSFDGGAFQSHTRIYGVPALTAPTFDIGQNALSGDIDGETLWFAAGTGTLTNADAATIDSWGNTDPSVANFPAAAQADFVWNGVGTNGSLK